MIPCLLLLVPGLHAILAPLTHDLGDRAQRLAVVGQGMLDVERRIGAGCRHAT